MRSRNIKPGLFKNEILGEADPIYTLLFAGLWTLADKEGRLECRPKKIKAELFPYRPELDVSMALAWLKHESFITVYESSIGEVIQINNWKKHQSPHHKEAESELPSEEEAKKTNKNNKQSMLGSSTTMLGSSKSLLDPLIPDSLNLIPLTPISPSGDDGLESKGEGEKPETPSAGKQKPESSKDEKREEAERLQKRFDFFYREYPVKKSKQPAFKTWMRLKPDDLLAKKIINHVRQRLKADPEWRKDGGAYIPHPSTFLNQRRWEDEYQTETSVRASQQSGGLGVMQWEGE